MRRAPRGLARGRLAPLALALACTPAADGVPASGQVPSDAAAPVAAPAGRLEAIRAAELTRRAGEVKQDDLASRDVEVRRAAARALARIGGPVAREGLMRALADDDAEVVAWAAYGLGFHCAVDRDATVRALVASWPRWRDVAAGAGLSPARSITRAVGDCNAPWSEATLVVWARQPPSRGYATQVDAIHALGDVATRAGKLREETFVELLKLAEGSASAPAVPEALFPVGRVEHAPPSVLERIREVAKTRLVEPHEARIFAIRALGRADPLAVPLLAGVALDAKAYDAAERTEAVRGLARFERDGQQALGEVVAKLSSGEGAEALVEQHFAPLLTAVEALREIGPARAGLTALASLAVPDGASAALRLRLSWLRCVAAGLLVERRYADPLLVGCDVSGAEGASVGARAVVAAIGVDAVKITGARAAAWKEHATGGPPRVRADALRLLITHPEVTGAAEILTEALRAEQPGVVAAAAEVVTRAPRRSAGADDKPHPPLVEAIVARLEGEAPADVEAHAALIDAAAALGVKAAEPALRRSCACPDAVLREHAQTALATLLGPQAGLTCPPPPEGRPAPPEAGLLLATPTILTVTTTAGTLKLELDPTLAPVAVTRVVALASSGAYDGVVVHRVVPGFVSQLGSPFADGYGAVGDRPPMPCETSPVPFTAGSVGVALAGRDTGSAQIFVTHTPQPHLYGKYAWLGRATGPWSSLVDGDVIESVRVQR